MSDDKKHSNLEFRKKGTDDKQEHEEKKQEESSSKEELDELLKELQNFSTKSRTSQEPVQEENIKTDKNDETETDNTSSTNILEQPMSKKRKKTTIIDIDDSSPITAKVSDSGLDVDCSRIEKDRHYIFTFGEFGSGKTTVNGMIAMLLHRMYNVISDPLGNSRGLDVMNQIQNSLLNGNFPDASRQLGTEGIWEPDEYKTSVMLPNGKHLNLSFVEMSGEDLHRIEITEENKKRGLHKSINAYFLCPNASITYILVADYNRVVREDKETKIKHSDILFSTFLSYLYRMETIRGKRVDIARVILVISKFDQNKNNPKIEDIVRKYLPKTYRFLKENPSIHQAKIFDFSVGEIDIDEEGKEYIATLNLKESAKKLTEYLLQIFIPPPKESWLTRLSKIMKS